MEAMVGLALWNAKLARTLCDNVGDRGAPCGSVAVEPVCTRKLRRLSGIARAIASRLTSSCVAQKLRFDIGAPRDAGRGEVIHVAQKILRYGKTANHVLIDERFIARRHVDG